MAVGSIAGALAAARQAKPRIALLLSAAAVFGFGCALAAIMPSRWLFGLALIIISVSDQTFTISTNSLVQLSTEPVVRGRVMAILLAVALGDAPIGAPIVGWVADRFGPRWALGVGAAAGVAAAMAGLCYLTKRGYQRESTLDASASFKAVGLKNPPTPFARIDDVIETGATKVPTAEE
jgi:MFS family permease